MRASGGGPGAGRPRVEHCTDEHRQQQRTQPASSENIGLLRTSRAGARLRRGLPACGWLFNCTRRTTLIFPRDAPRQSGAFLLNTAPRQRTCAFTPIFDSAFPQVIESARQFVPRRRRGTTCPWRAISVPRSPARLVARRRRRHAVRGRQRSWALIGAGSACPPAPPGSRSVHQCRHDGGPGSVLAERGDAGLEFGPQDECKETTKYVSANGLVELVEDRSSRQIADGTAATGEVGGLVHLRCAGPCCS